MLIEPHINKHYLDAIKGIYEHARVSRGGKRYWDGNGHWWKDESTYPDYLRFFFEKKKGKSYTDGFFNGNRRELLNMFISTQSGIAPTSERQRMAFDWIVKGYFDHLEELAYYEEQYYAQAC